jgi:phosphoribosylformylglycinamidine synthase
MKVKVLVTPKAAVLDPQGAAVRDAMKHLGMPEVSSVRIGKYLEIEVDDKTPNLIRGSMIYAAICSRTR